MEVAENISETPGLALYWRGQQAEKMLDLFLHMVNLGYIEHSSIRAVAGYSDEE